MTTARRKTASKTAAPASTVEPRLRQLEHEVGEIKTSISNQGTKIDQLLQAYTRFEAQRPRSLSETLSTVQSCAYLFALVVGGVLWISTQVQGGGAQELREAVARMDERLKAYERVLPSATLQALR